MPGGDLESLAATGRGVHVIFAHPQVDPERPDYLRLIVDDQDRCHGTSVPRAALM
jgi:hypothetical protein